MQRQPGSLKLAKSRPEGGYWLTTGVDKSTTIDGQNIVWGQNLVVNQDPQQ